MRSGGQQDLVLSDDLDFPVFEFAAAWADSQEEAEPDPTQDGSLPDASTPDSTGSSTKTSAKSAASTSSCSRSSADSSAPT